MQIAGDAPTWSCKMIVRQFQRANSGRYTCVFISSSSTNSCSSHPHLYAVPVTVDVLDYSHQVLRFATDKGGVILTCIEVSALRSPANSLDRSSSSRSSSESDPLWVPSQSSGSHSGSFLASSGSSCHQHTCPASTSV